MNKKVIALAIIVAGICAHSFIYAHGKKDGSQKQVELVIAAAASLTDSMNDVISIYEKEHPNVHIVPTYGSSGTLRKQIEQGAPAELFISANQSHMDTLRKQDLVDESSVKDMFENKVVLITPSDSTKKIKAYTDCGTDSIERIALGIPESVPAGDYAKQVFTALGIWDTVAAKTVYAKDVRQVLTYVEMGEVDAGVVYATDAAISKKVTIICEAPANTHKPILYPAAILAQAKHKKEAKAFFDYLSSKQAAKIFASYGFKVVK
ncbi:MAG: molybdate ABC transporter substrate-binding protein [Treponema sp.]|nr:molybdate ABC transporter substrate-binding protein [Treponema sp.]